VNVFCIFKYEQRMFKVEECFLCGNAMKLIPAQNFAYTRIRRYGSMKKLFGRLHKFFDGWFQSSAYSVFRKLVPLITKFYKEAQSNNVFAACFFGIS